MKKILFTVVLSIVLSCGKETVAVKEISKPQPPIVIDSCGRNMLKGTYISNSNSLDTIVIDSMYIKTNNISPCTGFSRGNDFYKYCVTDNKITLKYKGICAINLPEEIIGISIKSDNLYFDNVTYTSASGFYAHLTFYSYKKIK